MGTKSVLLVDDSPAVRSSLRELFSCHAEFEVHGEAENGREAIDKAETLRPDLIVLDLAMPVMNGMQAAPLLRAMLPNVGLILFTAHDGHALARLAQLAGIDTVVSKTQAVSELIAQARLLVGYPI